MRSGGITSSTAGPQSAPKPWVPSGADLGGLSEACRKEGKLLEIVSLLTQMSSISRLTPLVTTLWFEQIMSFS